MPCLLHVCYVTSDPIQVIAKMLLLLNRFRGRQRWPRIKLREVVVVNHGREIGLYRAKVGSLHMPCMCVYA